MLIVHVTLDVQVSANANSSVIANLKKAAALMHEPEFAAWYYRRHLFV